MAACLSAVVRLASEWAPEGSARLESFADSLDSFA